MENNNQTWTTEHSNGCSKNLKIIMDSYIDVNTGHESKNKAKERIISTYWWQGMDAKIEIHIKICDKCGRTRKGKRGSTTFASPLLQCSEPNQKISMD